MVYSKIQRWITDPGWQTALADDIHKTTSVAAANKTDDQDDLVTEIRRVFEELETDNSGTLDFNEVQTGLQRLQYPSSYANNVFKQIDTNNDATIDFDEFASWIQLKSADMKSLFESVDTDGSGYIDLEELKLMMYHLDMPIKNAKDLMAKLDVDGDKQVSFSEFRAGFSLLSPSHFCTMKDTWMEYGFGDSEACTSAFNVSRCAKREELATTPAWTSAVAGAVGNVCSRTLTSPAERVRLQMIADPGKYGSMMACMKDVVKNEGAVRGLFVGNALNCGRIAPQMGIAFVAKDWFKVLYAGGEDKQPSPLQTLAASMSSGMVCQTAIHPIDTLRVRLSTNPGAYNGAFDCLGSTVRTEGAIALFSGLPSATMFAVPYYGTQFFVYDMLKEQYATFGRSPDNPRKASPLIGIPLGSTASMVACFVAFPFMMSWRRIQVQGTGGRPIKYAGMTDCLRQVISREGFKGVYAGINPTLAKLLPTSALSFLAVEAIKEAMEWRPDCQMPFLM